MIDAKTIAILVQVLLIAGAINWGLVAYNGTDAVKLVTGGGQIEKIVKLAVAVAGLYSAYRLYVVYSQ
ncbi:MAG: DUF378 domain-containing protein [Proteobacteria bacterium]|nr:DUF378 domain-containing protein [Pseudomonadota bacterium]NBP13906.1 DUF378 domain-containing protein [bacterium]